MGKKFGEVQNAQNIEATTAAITAEKPKMVDEAPALAVNCLTNHLLPVVGVVVHVAIAPDVVANVDPA